MKYKISKDNNNKKLIIGVSILFCTVILIVGGSLAFFTGSDTKELGNIVSTDINGTIGYTDNKDYMRNNLIPVIETDVVKFAMKNSLNNFTDNDVCKYNDEFNACSLYEFTITNNADVTQELKVSMSPTLNQYGNLYFVIFEGNRNSLTTNSKIVHNSTHIEQDTINFNNLNLILKPKESKTYTIVFYIKSLNIDQTSVDSGKTFAASIKVDSITTGYSMSTQVGEGCYDFETLEDNTLKLTKFNGINHQTGDIIEGCGVTKDEDGYYSVTVPSTYGGNSVSTLGNNLFMAAVLNEQGQVSSTNIYSKINNIEVNDGIEYLEDGTASGTFAAIGMGIIDENYNLNIKLPNSLKNIGAMAFGMSAIKEIDLPNKLEKIGLLSFVASGLESIFIPSSVKVIEERAVFNNSNLTSLIFEGTTNGTSQLTSIGDWAFDYCNISSLIIPASVTTIGEYAFQNNPILTKIDFVGAKNGTSQLKEIGEGAFNQCNLTYDGSSEEEYLIIPESVTYIGNFAFSYYNTGNDNLKFIRYMGTREQLDLLWEKHYWYRDDIATVKAYGE